MLAVKVTFGGGSNPTGAQEIHLWQLLALIDPSNQFPRLQLPWSRHYTDHSSQKYERKGVSLEWCIERLQHSRWKKGYFITAPRRSQLSREKNYVVDRAEVQRVWLITFWFPFWIQGLGKAEVEEPLANRPISRIEPHTHTHTCRYIYIYRIKILRSATALCLPRSFSQTNHVRLKVIILKLFLAEVFRPWTSKPFWQHPLLEPLNPARLFWSVLWVNP